MRNVKVPHQKTFGFRQQLKLGQAIANQMPKMMPARECARIMGLSETMLRRIECQALAKVALRVQEAMFLDGIEMPIVANILGGAK